MTPEHRYVDKGKSGFHQKHKAESAAFKRMFDNVISKAIPTGSLIIVENFDRISCADIDTAIEDVKKMLRKGVSVMTRGALLNKSDLDKRSSCQPLPRHRLISVRRLHASVTGARSRRDQCPDFLRRSSSWQRFVS